MKNENFIATHLATTLCHISTTKNSKIIRPLYQRRWSEGSMESHFTKCVLFTLVLYSCKDCNLQSSEVMLTNNVKLFHHFFCSNKNILAT